MKRVLVVLSLVLILTLPAAGGSGRIAGMLVYLSGDQEVGPVINSFVGRFGIGFDDDLSGADVNLTIFAPNVIGAHFHCGTAGTNGPIGVNLVAGGLFFPAENLAGSFGKVMITNDDILPKTAEQCGMPINNIASLLNAISADAIYVNVHSTAFPGGALRYGVNYGDIYSPSVLYGKFPSLIVRAVRYHSLWQDHISDWNSPHTIERFCVPGCEPPRPSAVWLKGLS